MSDAPIKAPAAASRGPRVLLVISLCLNVALVVMIVVSFAIGFRNGFRHMQFSPRELLAQATGAERDKIQSVIDAHHARINVLLKASRDAHTHAIDVFEAPNFNKTEMSAAFEGIHQADDALHAETNRAAIEAMAQLSPGERKAFGDRLRRRARWWSWRKHEQ